MVAYKNITAFIFKTFKFNNFAFLTKTKKWEVGFAGLPILGFQDQHFPVVTLL